MEPYRGDGPTCFSGPSVRDAEAHSDAPHERTCIEEVRVAGARAEPEVVEEREEQRTVRVHKRRRERRTEV